jgi:hypothetical protein
MKPLANWSIGTSANYQPFFIMKRIISGIQQVGIGVANADEAFRWYRKIFGTDIVVFKDAATASLMKPYTGQQSHERYAILALNMQSGGGFEIWQYTSRTPKLIRTTNRKE